MTYDRETLYKEIWDEPSTRVAARYGVSAVALGKVCRKLKIPLPGRGYWARKAYGQNPPILPLPKAENLPVVARYKTLESPGRAKPDPRPETDDVRSLKTALNDFVYSGSSRLHTLVHATERALLKTAYFDSRGIPLGNGTHLDIRVTKDSLPRALRVMDRLLKMAESQGMKVQLKSHTKTNTCLLVSGEEVCFGITEKTKQSRRSPTHESDSKVIFHPTGLLSFRIWTWCCGGLKDTWAETAKVRLEDLTADFTVELYRVAIQIKERKEQQRLAAIEHNKRTHEIYELEKEIQQEKQRIKELHGEVSDWITAKRIRAYVSATLATVHDREEPQITAWAEWAKGQADRIDPHVASSPTSVLDRQDEIERFRRSW